MKTIVTTGSKWSPQLENTAKEIAYSLALPYIPRTHLSLDCMRKSCHADQILVATKQRLQLVMPDGVYFFHVGMAKLRIKSIREGKYDHMAKAMDLAPGHWVLDCTLGLGTDAIVASYLTGDRGRVVGLETSPIIAEILRRGLQTYEETDAEIAAAMRRIAVINSDYLDYLRNLPDKSFDVVYFDPMFRRPVKDSSGIAPLRSLANAAPLTGEAVIEAKRIARRRVVFKETSGSSEFQRLGFQHYCGGKYSSVAFGYIEPGEGE